MLKRLVCWWFGCDADYGCLGESHVQCKRCGAWDIEYMILVGETRHYRFCQLFVSLFRKVVPVKCRDCGKRSRCECDDQIPF